MKKRIKLKKQIKYLFLFLLLIVVCFSIYIFETGKVSSNNEVVIFEVKSGSTYSSIVEDLKEKNLIKSKIFYKIYIKINHPDSLQAGQYELSENMSVKELIYELGHNTKQKSFTITFREGINFRNVVSLITEKTNISEEEISNKIKDQSYLNSLIEKYWFLTDDIKNENIYYALEGYLFPDTYQFNEDSKIEDIFKIMLDNTEKKLSKYKKKINQNKYSIHQIMTMASIIELEASTSNDRAGVAGVFYNRLENGWSLGSDVTTYYGLKLNLSDRDLTIAEINETNNYNTRSNKMAGMLPISPICMPGIESIEASFNPETNDYYYFVADKTGKTYFNKTESKHIQTISKLKSDGLWYEY